MGLALLNTEVNLGKVTNSQWSRPRQREPQAASEPIIYPSSATHLKLSPAYVLDMLEKQFRLTKHSLQDNNIIKIKDIPFI